MNPDLQAALETVREALTWIKDHHDGVPEAEAALARIEQRIGELERVVEAALTWIKDHHDGVPEAEAALARIEQRIGELERVVEAARRFQQAYRQDREWDQEADELEDAIAALDGKEEG